MRTVISPKLLKLANNVAKIPFMKTLLRPLYYRYKQSVNNRRNSIFLKNGVDILKEFDSIMISNGINYTMTGGSMLGAVRERGFIKHDLDIDVAIWGKENPLRVCRILEENGFHLEHCFTLDNGSLAREDTYIKKDVSIDIFWVYDDGVQYHCDFQPVPGAVSWDDSMKQYGHVQCRRVEIPFSENMLRLPFENIEVNVAENFDEWLSTRYGRDYMIPNPRWTNAEHPLIKKWIGAKPNFTRFEI